MKTRYLFFALTFFLAAFIASAAKTNVVPVVTGQRVSGSAQKITRPVPALPLPGATEPAPAADASAAPGVISGAGTSTSTTNKVEEFIPVQALQMENMPLGQALEIYSELVNKTILRPANLPVTTFINFKARTQLTKSEAITAMETVFAMNGFTIIPIGDKFIKVVQEAQAGTQGGEFFKGDAKDLPVSGRFVTQIIQLKYVTVQDAVAAITPFAKGVGNSIVPIASTQTLVIRDYSENIKRVMEILEKIDTITPMEIKPEVIPIKYALASDIAQVLGDLTASGPGTTVGSRGKTGLSNTGATGSMGQQGQQGYQQGQPQTPGQGMLSSPATSGRSSFQQRLQSIVNRAASGGQFQILGETKIISDERTNSLLIFANDQDMVMIKTIISQLDVVLAQVLIEAIILDVSLEDNFSLGVSYLQQPKSLGNGTKTAGAMNSGHSFLNKSASSLLGGTNASGSLLPADGNLTGGFNYFANFGNSFDVAVNAFASDQRVNILSRPRIQTSHAVEARLFVGETVPYITGNIYYGTGNNASSQYQQKEVGISLTVLPLINHDGLVVMDISQNIEQIGANYDPSKADQIPPGTIKREALAKVAVRDRETIVLGGFITTEKRPSNSGVPYLKDIPVLGALFRSQSENNVRKELMVFLRPTVLPTPEAAAVAAREEKEKLPGVKQTEFELREEERKRNEAIEADMRKKLGIKEPLK